MTAIAQPETLDPNIVLVAVNKKTKETKVKWSCEHLCGNHTFAVSSVVELDDYRCICGAGFSRTVKEH